jgi:FG-GAP repeat protein
MGALLKTLRGVGLVAVVAMSLLGVTVSGASAASLPADPFLQQAGVSGPGVGDIESKNTGGESVALSADGNTALIGGFNAQWVFTRSGSTWTMQAKLTGSGETGEGQFGHSVALAADSKTALVGGPGDDGGLGAAWTFMRSGKAWNQQGEKLTGAGEVGKGRFGSGVAISSHGKTALIGGGNDNAAQTEAPEPVGAAWVFARSGKTWTQRGEKLTGGPQYGEAYCEGFGSSVALSSDGHTALIGDPAGAFACFGSASFLTRSGKGWTREEVEGIEGRPGDFAESVALSSDGNTGLIGEPYAYHFWGAALVFVR